MSFWNSFKKEIDKSAEETETPKDIILEETPKKPAPNFVEVPHENIDPLVTLYRKLNNVQLGLGQTLMAYERKKNSLLESLEELRAEIEREVEDLRITFGIPEDDNNYSLSLPTKDRDHALFIRDGQNVDPDSKEELVVIDPKEEGKDIL